MTAKRLLRAPLLHFVLLGALMHVGLPWWPSSPEASVQADAADVARLRREWRAETGRWPKPDELRATVERFLDEQALLAEALQRQLDVRDPVARERLLQNLRFAMPDFAGDDEAALAEARALGMSASDLVVRRRLIQLMEHRLAEDLPVDEAALLSYVAAHPERYSRPARLRLRQVYFAKSGDAGRSLAQAARSRLLADPKLDPDSLGEPFLLGESSAATDDEQLRRQYGAAFAAAVQNANVGEWSAPLQTAYGWHLVRLVERQPAQPADYAAVRQRAAYAWLAEQQQQRLQAQIAPLRARHRLPAAEQLLTAGAQG